MRLFCVPRRFVMGVLILCLFVLPANGQARSFTYDTLTAHLSDAERERLNNGEQIVNANTAFRAEDSLVLVPPPLAERLASFAEANSAGIALEALFFIRLRNEERELTTPRLLYNTIRSVSKLAGIEYYSTSRQRYRIFYTESYVIDDPKNRMRQPDPLLADNTPIPSSDVQYLLKHDSSFGRNIYRADYSYQDGVIALEITNLATMSYGIIPLLGPERLRTLVAIFPVEEGIILYEVSLVAINVVDIFGWKERVANSFTTRLIAISNWFTDQLLDSVHKDG